MLVSCLAYSSKLKMKSICSSETSVDFYQTTRRHNADDTTHSTYNILKCGQKVTETPGRFTVNAE
jgi:hypothetical protein